jgi:transposase
MADAVVSHVEIPDELYELRDLLEPTWPSISAGITGPRMEDGDGGGDGGGDGDGDSGDGDAGDAGDGDSGDGDAGDAGAGGSGDGGSGSDGSGSGGSGGKSDPDWKAHSRKHERNARRSRQVLANVLAGDTIAEAAQKAGVSEDTVKSWLPKETLERIQEREDQAKSDEQKRIDAAREEERTKLTSEFDKERRKARLESAATRAASKGVKVGEGDQARTQKFADADDAIVHVERAIANDEIEADDLFDEKGKIKQDELESVLSDVLRRKPHLALRGSGSTGNGAGPDGDADGGKGSGSGGTSIEDMTPEEHFEQIRPK